ncbi:unnamed protein product [Chilo suppressalis]|uniref:Juvenile hormone binding protein n=1 Tax=Chilo suppressalis TaxID=168631 RepID=A0ABN8AUM6_CHISP|nr:unnamed protein product [Chilo suppressalis]
MGVLIKFLLVFVFFKCAFCEEALLHPCNPSDMECLNKATESFMSKTSVGIPEYGIKRLEPMELKHVEYADPASDLIFHFKNITITGLKDQKISDFKMDTTAKSVVLQTRMDLNFASDLTIEMKEATKLLSGTYKAKATTLMTTKYTYNLKPNSEGVEFFEVGPETITCQAIGVPEVTLDPQFTDTIANDPDAVARRADYEKRSTEIRQKSLCVIAAEAYGTVVGNIRAAAKVLPKTAFFKDM